MALFVFSYQLKTRRSIVIVNALSRILYVAQYLVLGAFEGAFLDITAFFVTVMCAQAGKGFPQKHIVVLIVLSNLAVIGVGMLSYQNLFSLLPILGVIFETLALWLKKENHIRAASLLGAPFWLAYNLYCTAYGSAIGNVITLLSLSIAIFRYDIPWRKKK